MPCFHLGQLECGHDSIAPRHFACALRQRGGQGVPLAVGHPRCRHCATGEEISLASSRDFNLDPRPF
jgi:hypothetical protein